MPSLSDVSRVAWLPTVPEGPAVDRERRLAFPVPGLSSAFFPLYLSYLSVPLYVQTHCVIEYRFYYTALYLLLFHYLYIYLHLYLTPYTYTYTL